MDGVRVFKGNNREKYFSGAVNKDELKLRFSRNGKEFDVKVHTASFSSIKTLAYKAWEEERADIVAKKTGDRVAYIHMRAMGAEDLESFLLKMHTEAFDKDALILDLRYNNGGNVHKEVIDFLRGQGHFEWSYRDFPKTTHPNVAPAGKPIVVLVNEHSLSDAEVTSNGIKTLGIAKLVGTETYRPHARMGMLQRHRRQGPGEYRRQAGHLRQEHLQGPPRRQGSPARRRHRRSPPGNVAFNKNGGRTSFNKVS